MNLNSVMQCLLKTCGYTYIGVGFLVGFFGGFFGRFFWCVIFFFVVVVVGLFLFFRN